MNSKYQIKKDKAMAQIKTREKEFEEKLNKIIKPLEYKPKGILPKIKSILFKNKYMGSYGSGLLIKYTGYDSIIIEDSIMVKAKDSKYYYRANEREMFDACRKYYTSVAWILKKFAKEIKEEYNEEVFNYELVDVFKFKDFFSKEFIDDIIYFHSHSYSNDFTDIDAYYEILRNREGEIRIKKTKEFREEMKKKENKILTIEQIREKCQTKEGYNRLYDLKNDIAKSLAHYFYNKSPHYSTNFDGTLGYYDKNELELRYKFLIGEIFNDKAELELSICKEIESYESIIYKRIREVL